MKIAVVGKMRSGKDTFAKYFIENHDFKEFKFGTGIAEAIQKYFPEEWEKGKPRHLYQGIGQYFRSHDQDVWVRYMAKQIENDRPENIIVTDVRQMNEVDWLKENGFTIVVITAPLEARIERIKQSGDTFKEEDLKHETEKQVGEIVKNGLHDFQIMNTSTIEELELNSFRLYSHLKQCEMWKAVVKDGNGGVK